MRHTFYLVIFLTICPKLFLIYIEQKIANWAKANIEVGGRGSLILTNPE